MPLQLRSIYLSFLILVRMTIPAILACEYLKRRTNKVEAKPAGSASGRLRILLIRLDHIGDLVMCSSLVRELKDIYPTSEITLVVSSASRRVAEACPHVAKVLAVDTEDIKLLGEFRIASLGKILKFCRDKIIPGAFDLAIAPRWDADWYLAVVISSYSGAGRRLAFTERCSNKKRLLNFSFDRYFTETLAPGPLQHEVERNLDFARYLGASPKRKSTELWLTQQDRDFAEQWWRQNLLPNEDLVVAIAPGAKNQKCRWPELNFARLIDELWRAHHRGLTAIVICSPAEAPLAELIIANTRAKVLFPATWNIRQAAALIEKCSVLVGNNSGPIHLAAAARIPVVEISCHPQDGDPMDDLNPVRFGAFSADSVVVQPAAAKSPCITRCRTAHQHCITTVTVEMAATAVNRALNLETDRLIGARATGGD